MPLTSSAVLAQEQGARPPLIITSSPLPESLRSQIYTKPVQVREIKPVELVGLSYYTPTETLVTRKVKELGGLLSGLQAHVSNISSTLKNLQKENETKATNYYAAVATINTQLQAGTTPGNPRLLKKMSVAETSLDGLSTSVTHLNQLAVNTAKAASETSFLLDSTRATYKLSGAVEEDHVKLAKLEDEVNGTIVIIDRVLNNVNDDITRTSSYLSSERNNLRTLSLAVTNGDLYGKSLTNHPFADVISFAEKISMMTKNGAVAPEPRPLAKIRFDRQDVEYEQPVYMAVSETLERYPNARFDLVAVHSTSGNAAEIAIESTRARRNAERVLRTLTQMGLPMDRVDLSYSESDEATANEVHIYVQ